MEPQKQLITARATWEVFRSDQRAALRLVALENPRAAGDTGQLPTYEALIVLAADFALRTPGLHQMRRAVFVSQEQYDQLKQEIAENASRSEA